MQMVNLIEGGERARMSKRRGEFAKLDELLDDIGVDATRFFMLMRSHDTPIDIDLELARAALLRQPRLLRPVRPRPDLQPVPGGGRARCGRTQPADPAPAGTLEPAERALIARLLEMPDQIDRAATKREPHGIATYVREVAADFHAFYRDCRASSAPGPGCEPARLDRLRRRPRRDRDPARSARRRRRRRRCEGLTPAGDGGRSACAAMADRPRPRAARAGARLRLGRRRSAASTGRPRRSPSRATRRAPTRPRLERFAQRGESERGRDRGGGTARQRRPRRRPALRRHGPAGAARRLRHRHRDGRGARLRGRRRRRLPRALVDVEGHPLALGEAAAIRPGRSTIARPRSGPESACWSGCWRADRRRDPAAAAAAGRRSLPVEPGATLPSRPGRSPATPINSRLWPTASAPPSPASIPAVPQ